jgi:hypothetical protein
MATRLYGDPRSCPIESCTHTVRAGQLMCLDHWRQVPKGIQSDVYRHWRSWNRTHDDDVWAAYLEARAVALDVVEAAQQKH